MSLCISVILVFMENMSMMVLLIDDASMLEYYRLGKMVIIHDYLRIRDIVSLPYYHRG